MSCFVAIIEDQTLVPIVKILLTTTHRSMPKFRNLPVFMQSLLAAEHRSARLGMSWRIMEHQLREVNLCAVPSQLSQEDFERRYEKKAAKC